MDYEKRYQEALERAKKLKKDPLSVFAESTLKEEDTLCDYIFPELKESEDEKMLHTIIADFSGFKHSNTSTLESHFDECIKWLKSLSPQNHWKPSDEQIEALNAMILNGDLSYVNQNATLIKLYNDLKKLKD